MPTTRRVWGCYGLAVPPINNIAGSAPLWRWRRWGAPLNAARHTSSEPSSTKRYSADGISCAHAKSAAIDAAGTIASLAAAPTPTPPSAS